MQDLTIASRKAPSWHVSCLLAGAGRSPATPRKHPRMVLVQLVRHHESSDNRLPPRHPVFFFDDIGSARRQSGAMFDLTVDPGVARLAINRPEARNAIPLEGWARLTDAIHEATKSSARLLVLAGEKGGIFCAGADISDFATFQGNPAARSGFRQAIRTALDHLRDMAIPTVALVEGGCYGAGVAIAMACDLRIAGGDARFAITPAKLGISYPQEDVQRLVSLVGPGQAARLLFGAQAVDGAEALRIGLVEFHCEEAVEETLQGLAESFLANDRDSLASLKRGIGLAGAGISRDEKQDQIFDSLLGGEAVENRLAAYRNRPR